MIIKTRDTKIMLMPFKEIMRALEAECLIQANQIQTEGVLAFDEFIYF